MHALALYFHRSKPASGGLAKALHWQVTRAWLLILVCMFAPMTLHAGCLASATGTGAPLERLAYADPANAMPAIDREVSRLINSTVQPSEQDRVDLVHIYVLRGEALRQLTNYRDALASAQKAIENLSADDRSDLATRARSLEAQLKLETGIDSSGSALDVLVQAAKPGSVADACLRRDRAWATYSQSNTDSVIRSISDMQYAYQKLGEFGATSEQMIAAGRLSVLYAAVGQLDQAQILVQQSADYFVSEQAYVRAATAYDRMTSIFVAKNQIDAARGAVDKMQQYSLLSKDVVGQQYAWLYRCWLEAEFSTNDVAIPACAIAESVLQQDTEQDLGSAHQRYWIAKAQIQMRANQPKQVLQLLTSHQSEVMQALSVRQRLRYFALVAQAASAIGDWQRAANAQAERSQLLADNVSAEQRLQIAGFLAKQQSVRTAEELAQLQTKFQQQQVQLKTSHRWHVLALIAIAMLVLILIGMGTKLAKKNDAESQPGSQ